MQSTDSLRELNAKLLTEIAKLRKKFFEIKTENDKLKNKNTEIPKLRRKFAEIEAEIKLLAKNKKAIVKMVK
jgi:DNA repair exonuclease SbcCD ATPase subunit